MVQKGCMMLVRRIQHNNHIDQHPEVYEVVKIVGLVVVVVVRLDES